MRFCFAILLGAALACTAAETNHEVKVTSKVFDTSDKPVIGATIKFCGSTPSDSKSTITDSNGIYTLMVTGSGYIVAQKQGFAPAWTTYLPGMNPPHPMQMKSPTNITGIVVDEMDHPVTNAQVLIDGAYLYSPKTGISPSYFYKAANEGLFQIQTFGDGKFEIGNLSENTAIGILAKTDTRSLRLTNGDTMIPYSMVKAGTHDVRLIIEPVGCIEGKMTFPTNSPLPENTKIIAQRVYSRHTIHESKDKVGADGKFSIPKVPAGSYIVKALFPTNEFPKWVTTPLRIEVKSNETNQEAQIEAMDGGLIEIQVRSAATHKPIQGVEVTTTMGDDEIRSITNPKGLVSFWLVPDKYEITLRMQNYEEKVLTVNAVEQHTNHWNFEIIPTRKMKGIITDLDGKPAEGVSVILLSGSFTSILTDSHGAFDFGPSQQKFDFPPYIVAIDTNRNLAASKPFEENNTNLTLQLEPGLTLKGNVKDVNGIPLTNVQIDVNFITEHLGIPLDVKGLFSIDDHGNFMIHPLPRDGRYSINVSAEGYSSKFSESWINDNDLMKSLQFILKIADKKVAGRVVDENDMPVVNATINVGGNEQPVRSAQSDTNGFFTIDKVCEGKVNLFATLSLSTEQNRIFSNARANAGDTNVVIKFSKINNNVIVGSPQSSSASKITLKGKPLPDLSTTGAGVTNTPNGKRTLVMLFDFEQRPSRRFVKLLSEKKDKLSQNNILVTCINIAPLASNEDFQEWKNAGGFPFQIGFIKEKNKDNKWMATPPTSPWFILTDTAGKVTNEGVAIEELDSMLK